MALARLQIGSSAPSGRSLPRAPDALDVRTAEDVYRDALRLARSELPEWAAFWPPDAQYFATDDSGLVLLQLLGRLHASVTTQLNRVPDKYRLAFLDFYGIALRAPVAASVPLTFQLAQGANPVVLPAGTQVAAANAPNLLFETCSELRVLPVTPTAARRLDPASDSWSDLPPVAGLGAEEQPGLPLDHALFLGGTSLFLQPTALESLSVTLEGVNLSSRLFARWSDGAGNALRPQVELDRYDTLTVSFDGFVQPQPSDIAGISSAWLQVRPAEGVRIRSADATILPGIFGLSATARSRALPADATFTNGTPVDVTRGGAPFGKTPAVEDAFYVASADVFSRVGAQVILELTLVPVDPPTAVEVAWEYWGDGWLPLQVVDGTAAFTRPGTVTFSCPAMPLATINGKKSRWVRARIASGGYGTPAGIVETVTAESVVDDLLAPYLTDTGEALHILQENDLNFGYQYRPANFAPPFLAALRLRFVLTDRPTELRVRNGFQDAPLEVQPYLPPADERSALSLAFDPAPFLRWLPGNTLPLLVLLPEAPSAAGASAAVWEGFDGRGWRALQVEDGTHRFTTDGVVSIRIPRWIAASNQFGQNALWLRLRAPDGDPTALPAIARVVTNSVEAVNGVSWEDEILGSGTGGPGLGLSFARAPVLEGQVVEVLEPAPLVPTHAPGGEPLAPPQGAAAWVEWTEVGSFAFSGSQDRHYVLDHTDGTLTFGDGQRGMAPPKGENNIRAREYQSGGGAKGNVAAETLTQIQRARPGLASVTNVVPAQGGADADTLDVLRTLGPLRMKAQGRAVSGEDFATLARTTSPRVAQATAEEDARGALVVTLLPNEDGTRPTVTSLLVDEVRAALQACALPLVAPRLVVQGPRYRAIDVTVNAVLDPSTPLDQVRARMMDRLTAYFAPMAGPESPGWSFGAVVSAAELATVLAEVEGVAAIDGVALGEDLPTLPLTGPELPCAGALALEVARGG